MATNFPSSLDAFTNPSSTDALDSVSVPHATQHSDLNDAVEALEAKVGADSSAVATSHDYKIAALESDVAGLVTGKILQVVRATDTTRRTTTSTSFGDANISVTITPTAATSNILLVWSSYVTSTNGYTEFIITDSSDVSVMGSQVAIGDNISGSFYTQATFVVWDSPATTSATTYKGRWRKGAVGTSSALENNIWDGQLFAIEVGA